MWVERLEKKLVHQVSALSYALGIFHSTHIGNAIFFLFLQQIFQYVREISEKSILWSLFQIMSDLKHAEHLEHLNLKFSW